MKASEDVMMKELNLQYPSYSEEYLKQKKEEGSLKRMYVLGISMGKYLKKYRLFEQGITNADAVILFSSCCKPAAGFCCFFHCGLSFKVKKYFDTV